MFFFKKQPYIDCIRALSKEDFMDKMKQSIMDRIDQKYEMIVEPRQYCPKCEEHVAQRDLDEETNWYATASQSFSRRSTVTT